jgi:hypothetical protein
VVRPTAAAAKPATAPKRAAAAAAAAAGEVIAAAAAIAAAGEVMVSAAAAIAGTAAAAGAAAGAAAADGGGSDGRCRDGDPGPVTPGPTSGPVVRPATGGRHCPSPPAAAVLAGARFLTVGAEAGLRHVRGRYSCRCRCSRSEARRRGGVPRLSKARAFTAPCAKPCTVHG